MYIGIESVSFVWQRLNLEIPMLYTAKRQDCLKLQNEMVPTYVQISLTNG